MVFDPFSTLVAGLATLRERPPAVSPNVRSAVDLVRGSQSTGSLGFFARQSRARDLGEVMQVLAEHGQQLSATDTDKVFAALKSWDALEEARRRFLIQFGLSALVLVTTGCILTWGHPGADAQKTLFGLIGTVIGYWLR